MDTKKNKINKKLMNTSIHVLFNKSVKITKKPFLYCTVKIKCSSEIGRQVQRCGHHFIQDINFCRNARDYKSVNCGSASYDNGDPWPETVSIANFNSPTNANKDTGQNFHGKTSSRNAINASNIWRDGTCILSRLPAVPIVRETDVIH